MAPPKNCCYFKICLSAQGREGEQSDVTESQNNIEKKHTNTKKKSISTGRVVWQKRTDRRYLTRDGCLLCLGRGSTSVGVKPAATSFVKDGSMVLTQHSSLTFGSRKADRANSGHTSVNRFCWRFMTKIQSLCLHLHLCLKRGLLGTTNDFTTSLLQFLDLFLCTLELVELQARPFPDVVFQPLLLSALSSSPFHCALQDGFDQT